MDDLGGILGGPDNPLSFVGDVDASEIPQGTDEIRVRFEFVTDGGWSDEDGGYCSTYGPMGIDDVTVAIDGASVAAYNFDDDDEGWTFESVVTQPPGLIGVNELSNYGVVLPPECELEGFVLEFHDDEFLHPEGQYDAGMTPIIDRSTAPFPAYEEILAVFDLYAGESSGEFLWRPGWRYYPWICEPSGVASWSPRVGTDTWYISTGECFEVVTSAVQYGVPPDAEQYRFMIELMFPEGSADPAPLIDNVQVCFVGEEVSGVPEAGALSVGTDLHHHPNPFTTQTAIRFALDSPAAVNLAVYDAAGRLINQLIRRSLGAGLHAVSWNGKDQTGSMVAPGIYWSRLKVGERVEKRKVTIIR
ncbi:MAG: T9SS type A sorting domain-containing protein [Candidatus Eisenbacteria bacterium]|nr:T9SS type A sorting domain-containing protein [Candidatus Eisenbacteria bacterium]